MQRVSTLNPDNTTAMPTKLTLAQRWVEEGKAEWVKTDLRIKAVRLMFEPSGRGETTVGWVSGDTAKMIALSDFNWKRMRYWSPSKTQVLRRNTGLLVDCPRRLSVLKALNLAA